MKLHLHTRAALVACIVVALAILAGCDSPTAPEAPRLAPADRPADVAPWIVER